VSFTAKEVDYLRSQRLGRLATVNDRGDPHNVPVVFTLNTDLGTVDITGRGMDRSRKFRDVQRQPAVSFVVDDVPSTDPWVARGVEIRGKAEAIAAGGDGGTPTIRITPTRIVAWGVDAGWQAGTNARDVG
jgi:PPOX class F420-dependent enzyme/OxyR family protein